MNALILGGNSQRHKQWVRDVADVIRPQFTHIQFVDYRHWEPGAEAENADVPYEIDQAASRAATLHHGGYIIVAKSVGTAIAALGIAQHRLTPSSCLFLGVALALSQKTQGVASAYGMLPPTLIAQQEHDPLGSYDDVHHFVQLHGARHVQVKMLPGATHDYSDFELISRLAKEVSGWHS